MAPASQYVFDMEDLYTKILDDIVDAQEPSGLVPTMAPEIRYMCGPLHDTITWGGAVCLLPDHLKKYYGSTHVFPKVYPAAARYMEYMLTKERDGGLIEHGLGDWGRDIAWGNLQPNIETAIYYKCLQSTAMMARDLGLSDEAEKYDNRALRIREAYNKHLLITDDSTYPHVYYTSRDNFPARDRQAVAQAFALQFDLVPSEFVEDVQKSFLADVADCRIRSGEIGLRFLFNTLIDLKRPDIALAMIRQEEHPSYMRFLRNGETTFLEFWQDECRSKSHDLFCTIHEWFYAGILGLKPDADAYKTFTISPPYHSEFDEAHGHVESPYGLISVAFRKNKTETCVKVSVPVGTEASLHLPIGVLSARVSRQGDGESTKTADGQILKFTNGTYTINMDTFM